MSHFRLLKHLIYHEMGSGGVNTVTVMGAVQISSHGRVDLPDVFDVAFVARGVAMEDIDKVLTWSVENEFGSADIDMLYRTRI